MAITGRPSIWVAHRPEIVHLYTEEHLSRGQIARRLNTSVQTVTRQLLAADVSLVNRRGDDPRAGITPERQAEINQKISEHRRGKGVGPRIERQPGMCAECEERPVGRHPGAKFCGSTCNAAYNARVKHEESLAAYEADPRRCPCGTAIPYEGRHTRQFCNEKHRLQFQTKRQADPTNSRTFTCGNPKCAKTVTRYNSYGRGAAKYCSVACSNKMTKIVRHYVVRDMDMVLDSGWEVAFAGLCCFLKIPVERIDRSTAVGLGPNSHYAPDFWLPTVEVHIEAKGQVAPDDPIRWAAWREQRGPLAVVGKAELDELRRAADADAFVALLRGYAGASDPVPAGPTCPPMDTQVATDDH